MGPHRDLEGRRRLDAVVVQGADDLEAGQHAEHAAELAAGRLGVEVAAGGDRRQRRVAARAPGEDVAHPVDGDGAAGLLAPAHEEVAPLAVEVAEREAAVAAGHARADLRSEEHTSELQSLMRISYAVFCLKKKI